MNLQYNDCFESYRKHQESFEIYKSLIVEWSRAVNLVSRETLGDLEKRHILDSLQLLKFMSPLKEKVVVDVGSGAGFPGLVLSILGFEKVLLVEADTKKAFFLKTVIRDLGLNAQVINERVENLKNVKADIIVSRAFAPLNRLISLIYPLLHDHSFCLLHKGVGVKKELEVFESSWYAECEFFPSLYSDGSILKLANIAHRDCGRESKRRGG